MNRMIFEYGSFLSLNRLGIGLRSVILKLEFPSPPP